MSDARPLATDKASDPSTPLTYIELSDMAKRYHNHPEILRLIVAALIRRVDSPTLQA